MSRQLLVAALLSAAPQGSWAEAVAKASSRIEADKASLRVEAVEHEFLDLDEDYDVEDSLLEEEASNRRSRFDPEEEAGDMIGTFDSSEDGYLDLEEAEKIPGLSAAEIEEYFELADVNNDEKVSAEELQMFLEGMDVDPEKEEGSSPKAESLLEGSFKERVSSLIRQFDQATPAADLLKEFDSSKDGYLDLEEAEKIPGLSAAEIDVYFERADTDGDSKVSLQELTQLLEDEDDDSAEKESEDGEDEDDDSAEKESEDEDDDSAEKESEDGEDEDDDSAEKESEDGDAGQ